MFGTSEKIPGKKEHPAISELGIPSVKLRFVGSLVRYHHFAARSISSFARPENKGGKKFFCSKESLDCLPAHYFHEKLFSEPGSSRKSRGNEALSAKTFGEIEELDKFSLAKRTEFSDSRED